MKRKYSIIHTFLIQNRLCGNRKTIFHFEAILSLKGENDSQQGGVDSWNSSTRGPLDGYLCPAAKIYNNTTIVVSKNHRQFNRRMVCAWACIDWQVPDSACVRRPLRSGEDCIPLCLSARGLHHTGGGTPGICKPRLQLNENSVGTPACRNFTCGMMPTSWEKKWVWVIDTVLRRPLKVQCVKFGQISDFYIGKNCIFCP